MRIFFNKQTKQKIEMKVAFVGSVQSCCPSAVFSSSRRRRYFSQRTRRTRALYSLSSSKKSSEKKKKEELDLECGIEPCLVGFVTKDENGIEMYCCEQPDGSLECKTLTSSHESCEVIEGKDGELRVNCSPQLKKDM